MPAIRSRTPPNAKTEPLEPLLNKGYSQNQSTEPIPQHTPVQPRSVTRSLEKLDPFDSDLGTPLYARVLETYGITQSAKSTIESIWNCTKGSSKAYRMAKWKFRQILHSNVMPLPGKSFGQDPDDPKTFEQLFKELRP